MKKVRGGGRSKVTNETQKDMAGHAEDEACR